MRFSVATTSVAGARSAKPREVAHVEEHQRHLDLLALGPALLEDVLGDVAVDVGAERLADPLALAQPPDHAVEAGLEEAQLAGVVDGDLDVEVAPLDLVDRPPHRGDRVGHRARGEDDREQAEDERDPAEGDHGSRQLAAVDVLAAHRVDGHDHEAQQRHGGAERPGDHGARGDAGDHGPLRRPGHHRPGRGGAQDPLGEQVGERRHRDPAERDGDRDRQAELRSHTTR